METWRDELYHHGILGQKWGVRRYQNPDGSLTPEGRKRYLTNAAQQIGKYYNGKKVHSIEEEHDRRATLGNKVFRTFDKETQKNITDRIRSVNMLMASEYQRLYFDMDSVIKDKNATEEDKADALAVYMANKSRLNVVKNGLDRDTKNMVHAELEKMLGEEGNSVIDTVSNVNLDARMTDPELGMFAKKVALL